MAENDKKTNAPNKWLMMVDKLAKGDITKHSAVYDLNYIHSLNMLGHWKQIDEQKENNK